jgi:hypothetical protein
MKKATFGWPFSWALDFAKLLMRQEQKPKRVSGFQMFVGQLQAVSGDWRHRLAFN